MHRSCLLGIGCDAGFSVISFSWWMHLSFDWKVVIRSSFPLGQAWQRRQGAARAVFCTATVSLLHHINEAAAATTTRTRPRTLASSNNCTT
ncbi:hypothetical protein PVAP13_3KG265857 [Panicum virgatum]|uniref:Uncharacterized protein n=1 Tax=Panicum virgatum TaxID=38727 RepID=A0A8T0UUD9_PANVG|nr:hypothetical protein PVAP13_3KG265857 [Panicum virgatum]